MFPITDEIGTDSADLGDAQPLARDGIVDVTAPPFSADSTGVADATAALQSAVDWARANYAIVYLP